MDNKKLTDIVTSLQEKVKENSEKLEQLQAKIRKLENPGAREIKDVNINLKKYKEEASIDANNVLSNYARKVVKDSPGPLKADELLTHFMNNDFGKKKEAMTVIKKFPDSIDEVKKQLSRIQLKLESEVTRRKEENKLDMQLIPKIQKFVERLRKEQIKGGKLNIKIESSIDEPPEMTIRNKEKLLETENVEKSLANKPGISVKQQEERGRKRKLEHDNSDSCSSSEIKLEQLTEYC